MSNLNKYYVTIIDSEVPEPYHNTLKDARNYVEENQKEDRGNDPEGEPMTYIIYKVVGIDEQGDDIREYVEQSKE